MSGDVPEGWRRVELGAFCREHSRRAGNVHAPIYSVSKDHGLIAQTEIFDKRIASANTSNYKLVRRGEYAYDPMLLWTGSIARLERADEVMISPAYTTFSVDGAFAVPAFLDLLLRAPRMVARYRSISHGTNVRRKKASFEEFSFLNVKLPSIPEQLAIASLVLSLAAVATHTEAVIREINLAKARLSSVRDPARTRRVKLKDVVSELDSGVSVSGDVRPLENGQIGVLRTSSVSQGFFDPEQYKVVREEDRGRVAESVKADRIIVNRANTTELAGSSAYVATSNDRLFLSDKLWQLDVTDRSVVNVRWLALALASDRARARLSQLATGTSGSMKNVSKGSFLSLTIELPPIETQSSVGGLGQALEERLAGEKRAGRELRAFHATLSSELLSGRVRLPESMIARFRDPPEQAA